jgi:hypothetical protein
LAGIIFGFVHFRGQIAAPFLRSPANNPAVTLENNPANTDLLGLSQRDTDQDGLSDFDELNIYRTSPYLADSDSDGVSDQQEIARGNDPNCPTGQNCLGFSDLNSARTAPIEAAPVLTGEATPDELRALLRQAGISDSVINNLSDQEIFAAYQEVLYGDSSTVSPVDPVIEISENEVANITPDQIRRLLREQAGISDEVLSQISDAQLLEFFYSALE